MSNPSRLTLQTEWANAIKVLDETRRFGNAGGYPAGNATNLISLLDTLQQSYQGDFLDDEETIVEGIRGSVAGIVSPQIAASIQRPFLRQYCKSVIGRTNLSSDLEMWMEMYKYFIDNNLKVQSRAFTFGTPSAAGANIGNGQVVRLTTDMYNFPIESGYVDSKRAICIADENSGTRRGQETFQIKGQSSARDELERSGSGLTGILTGLTIDDSILQNSGFRTFAGTASSPTGITGWTSTGGDSSSIYTFDSTNFFRVAPSDGTTSYAITLNASTRLQQKLSVRGTTLSPSIPYIMAVIWNRAVGSGSGTFNFRMGSIVTTVSVSAQTGWNVTLVPNPIGQGAWYKNFAQADLQFEIEWIRTSGTVNVGEVLVCPGTQYDGHWYWAIPASTATYAQWRVLDQYTWPDIATGSAKIQTWIHRGFPGVYLPSSNGSSIGWTEP